LQEEKILNISCKKFGNFKAMRGWNLMTEKHKSFMTFIENVGEYVLKKPLRT
jgi:hypothetical protein